MMTENVYYATRPDPINIFPFGSSGMCRIDLPRNIEEVDGIEDTIQYRADVYSINTSYRDDLYQDIEENYDEWLEQTIEDGSSRPKKLKSIRLAATNTFNPNGRQYYRSRTLTENFGNTVYDGKIDFVTGKLTIYMAEIPSYNYEAINEPWLSDRDEFVSGTYPTAGAQVVYPLTTPIVYNLTPHQIDALLGRNIVWSDEGDMSIRVAEGVTDYKVLDTLPLTVTVTGAGDTGNTTVAIIRDGNAHTTRPDDSEIDGFDGETIAFGTHSGESEFIFDKDDLIGYLDDDAYYKIQASVTDSIGQSTDPVEMPFFVKWNNQANIPSATIEVDSDESVVYITPQADNVNEGDTCDIYRLSSDKPELIVTKAEFGSTYIDPYPAFGKFGGHRIVYITKNGDYTTEDRVLAFTDYGYDEGDFLDKFNVTIDFGNEQVILPYDISVSHKWTKDFTETKYLGGHVRGDWNKAVSKSTTVNTTVIIEEDPDQVRLMRDLAMYPGLCHVRTPDGASFTADVEVNEDHEERWVNRLAKFSLSITRVDNEGYDGKLAYSNWTGEEE